MVFCTHAHECVVVTDAPTDDSWIRLLEEMDSLASAKATNGWDTLTIPAGDAGPEGPDAGLADRHGYAYVVPGDAADAFLERFDPRQGQFPETELYRRATPETLSLLTVFTNPQTEVAIFLAGVLDRTGEAFARCREAAEQTGRMHSHLFRVDGTHLGSFEHADPAPFFSDSP